MQELMTEWESANKYVWWKLFPWPRTNQAVPYNSHKPRCKIDKIQKNRPASPELLLRELSSEIKKVKPETIKFHFF